MVMQLRLGLLVEADGSALHVRPLPHTPSLPRHLLLPPWHYDMMLDGARGAAYEAAIRCVCARARV